MQMLVSTENGTVLIDSFADIEAVIRRSAARGMAEIWLSGDAHYPAIAILLNGDHACVDFFGTDNDNIKMTLGNYPHEIMFRAGGEEWLAPANAVISLDEAVLCAEEFCHSLNLPACVTWQDGV